MHQPPVATLWLVRLVHILPGKQNLLKINSRQKANIQNLLKSSNTPLCLISEWKGEGGGV